MNNLQDLPTTQEQFDYFIAFATILGIKAGLQGANFELSKENVFKGLHVVKEVANGDTTLLNSPAETGLAKNPCHQKPFPLGSRMKGMLPKLSCAGLGTNADQFAGG